MSKVTYRFETSKALLKGAGVALASWAVAELNNLVNNGSLPTTVEEWKERGPILLLSLGAGAIKTLWNVWKHREALKDTLRS